MSQKVVPTGSPPVDSAKQPQDGAQVRRRDTIVTTDSVHLEIDGGRRKKERPVEKKLPKVGDYTVKITVVEARELKPRDAGGISDPMIVIQCMNQKKRTKVQWKTLNCVFDESFDFEFTIEEPTELLLAKLTLTAYDYNRFLRHREIGAYEFDLAFIYDQPYHEIYKSWVPLTDTTDTYEGVQGYVCLCISVLGPGDEQKVSHVEPDPSVDFKTQLVDTGGQEQSGYLLLLDVYRADDLPKVDVFGAGINAYVQARFAGNPPVKTDVVDGFSPEWNSELQVPVMWPAMTDRVELSIFDYNKISSDRMIATCTFSFSDILREGFGPSWINLYGAPTEFKTKDADLMNSSRRAGNCFKGRIYLSAAARKQPDPKLAVVKIEKEKVPKPLNSVYYTLRMDLYAASDLPAASAGISTCLVEVSIGNASVFSKQVPVKDGLAAFQEQLSDLDVEFPTNISLVPDIFISLYANTKRPEPTRRMCFIRLKAKDVAKRRFKHMKPKRWTVLQDDTLSDAVEKSDFAGFLLYTIGFGVSTEAPKNREPLWKPKMNRYELRAHIYQARNLPPADEEGTTDAYVRLRFAGQTAETQIKKFTLFPVWYETLLLHVNLPEPLALSPAVSLSVMDWDKEGSHDLVGRFFFEVTKASEKFIAPTWHKIFIDSPDNYEGEVLASFQLIPLEKPYIPPIPNIKPVTKNCTVLIHVIGIRGLVPMGLQNPQAPYLEFDLGEAKNFITEKSKKPSVLSPNYIEIIEINFDLPLRRMYTPTVNVRVRDSRLGGLSNRVIATTSIPLGNFLPWPETDSDDSGMLDNIPLTLQPTVLFNYLNQITKPDAIVDAPPKYPFLEFGEPESPRKEDPGDNLYESGASVNFQSIYGAAGQKTNSVNSADYPPPEDIKITIEPELAPDTPSIVSPTESTVTQEMATSAKRDPEEEIDQKEDDTVTAVVGRDGLTKKKRRKEKKIRSRGDEFLKMHPQMTRDEALKRLDKKRKELLSMLQLKPKSEDLRHDLNEIDETIEGVLDPNDWFDNTPEFLKGRVICDDELEDFLNAKADPPFDDFLLTRGQKRGISEIEKLLKLVEGVKVVGKLKSKILVLDNSLNASDQPAFNFETFRRPRSVVIRLYVVKGVALKGMDSSGTSDPYLKIKFGDKTVDDSDHCRMNTNDPEFYRAFEFQGVLPGISQMDIEVWDQDNIAEGGTDDLIGSTSIDVENLFFHSVYNKMKEGKFEYKEEEKLKIRLPKHPVVANLIPLEFRTLKHPKRPTISVGKLSMWLEILTKGEASGRPLMNITQAAREKFEFRIVVYQARNMTIKDAITKMNDLYIVATLDGGGGFKALTEETDTHWRAKKGKGSFNFRMKFEIELPIKDARLKLAAWDRDIIGANDSIGEAIISLERTFNLAMKKLEKKVPWGDAPFVGLRRQWVPVFSSDSEKKPGPNGERPNEGEIEIEVDLLPVKVAEQRQAGKGRDEPNRFPVLDPPTRTKFNPFRPDLMLKEVLGPELCAKIGGLLICGCLCFVVILLAVMFVPTLAGTAIGSSVKKR